MSSDKPLVGILMGSDSDWSVMRKAADTLTEFGVAWEAHIMSAHRTPDLAANYAREAEARGLRVIIAGAGLAAHLAGALAAQTVLPVIGVPLAAGSLQGMDALLATVQMPPGVPVATVGVGMAQNAALLAIQILGVADETLRRKFSAYKNKMAQGVSAKDQKLQAEIQE